MSAPYYGQRVIHPGQTTKQPVVWICDNEDCRVSGKNNQPKAFNFESEEPICPKCGADGYPHVQKRILVHLLVRNPKGAIQGHNGRFELACDPQRDFIANLVNGEAGTGEIEPVNCPGCLKRIKEQKLGFQGQPIRLEINYGVATDAS